MGVEKLLFFSYVYILIEPSLLEHGLLWINVIFHTSDAFRSMAFYKIRMTYLYVVDSLYYPLKGVYYVESNDHYNLMTWLFTDDSY